MENLITAEIVEKNESLLEKRIFTKLQLNILKKKLRKKDLNINEKTYYYKYIKPKIRVMMSFFNIDEIRINGKEQIIEDRIPRAIEILNRMNKKHKNKKIMISGSFLFSKKYNDIDVFIFTKYNKEDYYKGKLHVNFLPESALNSLFYSSLSKICISNFRDESKLEFDIKLVDILQSYEILVNLIINKEDYKKELRDFLIIAEYISKEVILSSKQLYYIIKKIEQNNIIKIISKILIETIALGYRKKTLKDNLKKHLEDYNKLLEEYKQAKNIPIYIQTYKEAIELVI